MAEFAVAVRNRRVLDQCWQESKVRETPAGRERFCNECSTWKPMDEAHFGFLLTRGHFRSHCRLCEARKQRARRAMAARGKQAARRVHR